MNNQTPDYRNAILRAFKDCEVVVHAHEFDSIPISSELSPNLELLMDIWDRSQELPNTKLNLAIPPEPVPSDFELFKNFNAALPIQEKTFTTNLSPPDKNDSIMRASIPHPTVHIHYTTDGKIDRQSLYAQWMNTNTDLGFEKWAIEMKIVQFAKDNELKIADPECFSQLPDESSREFIQAQWQAAFETQGTLMEDWYARIGRFIPIPRIQNVKHVKNNDLSLIHISEPTRPY